jgi:DNA topoisomerase IB
LESTDCRRQSSAWRATLGNTKAVCRKCYIHPAVIEAYVDGRLAEAMTVRSTEACVRRLLSQRTPRSPEPVLKRSLRKLRRRGTHFAPVLQLP